MNFSAGSRRLNLWLLLFPLVLTASLVVGQAFAGNYRAHADTLLAAPPGGAEIAPDIEQGILIALNQYRASKGRKAIAMAREDLVLAARAHAMDLLAMGKVGHVAATGHDFEARMRALRGGGLVMLPAMSENAARDRRKNVTRADKALGLMQQWIESPRHRKSLTDRSFVSVAIGAVKDGDAAYAVQIFVGPETKSNLFNGN